MLRLLTCSALAFSCVSISLQSTASAQFSGWGGSYSRYGPDPTTRFSFDRARRSAGRTDHPANWGNQFWVNNQYSLVGYGGYSGRYGGLPTHLNQGGNVTGRYAGGGYGPRISSSAYRSTGARRDHPANWGNREFVERQYSRSRIGPDYWFSTELDGGYGSSNADLIASGTYEEGLWDYLTRGHRRYQVWDSVPPGSGSQVISGSGPHGRNIRIYANRVAMRTLDRPSYQSLIVLEGYQADQQTLDSIYVMYRSVGYDPEHKDWYWVQFEPRGNVARSPGPKNGRMLAGRVETCIQCHSQAADGDYVYSND